MQKKKITRRSSEGPISGSSYINSPSYISFPGYFWTFFIIQEKYCFSRSMHKSNFNTYYAKKVFNLPNKKAGNQYLEDLKNY